MTVLHHIRSKKNQATLNLHLTFYLKNENHKRYIKYLIEMIDFMLIIRNELQPPLRNRTQVSIVSQLDIL